MAEWRTTPLLNGWYEVSDAGEIRRVCGAAKGKKTAKPGQVLNARVAKNGRRRINLSIAGKRLDAVRISLLVCEAFHGPAPTPKHTVNHKNGVRADDRAENLEWATMSEQHIHRHYVLKSYQGRPPGGYKLTEDDVREIKRLIREEGRPDRWIAARFGVTDGAIWFIRKGRSWKCVSD